MLLLAGILLLVSPGPVLYRQPRIGRHGEHFDMLKVRSMRPGAELSTGPTLATPNDPRLVPGFGLVRALHLDELPQLWNVLKGSQPRGPETRAA